MMAARRRTDAPDYARELRRELVDPFAVCEALGLIEGKGSFTRQAGGLVVRCPWHTERSPSCSIQVKAGSLVAHCFSCGEGGDVLELLAAVHGLSTKRDFRAVLIAAAELAHNWTALEDLEGRKRPAAERKAKPIAPRPPVEDTKPAALDSDTFSAIAERLLERCPLAADDDVRADNARAVSRRWR